ncbi:helix-turn-helix transcriptional regulator [Streptomyces sp. HNM0574]|uniref:helix-turn-helix transcriptional regulator n=1 Tax=Streptomyces sp. HNM0574 TaxID=2714954 RepID=UPI00146D8C72|nr:helix-turn-helix transcriptional regulator [Streptomyces sp. HNM0574]NLU69204.1 helix-turn-helix transcriptional regulator [Streptomyces sp. HNM0574]
MYVERASRVPGAVAWTGTGAPDGTTRVLPDGCMDLLLWNGRLVIAGPDSRPHVFAGTPGDRVTGLRFAPGTAPPLLGVPAHELRDRRVPLSDLWPAAEVRPLEERAAAARDPARVLEEAAARRAGPREEDPVRAEVVRLLRGGSGVTRAARAVGLSERQLRRRSLDAFGYGPKTLARVLRMQRAVTLAGQGVALAEVAARTGYADQAHLARDVRALTGVPASSFSPPAPRRGRP